MKNQVMTWLQKWSQKIFFFFSMGKTFLFTWECGRFYLEQSVNILNSNVCCCCGFHWTVTAQVSVEVISRAVSNAYNHVWTQEGPGDEVISASVCTCIRQCWRKMISRSMCFLMGKSSFQLNGHFTSALLSWNIVKCDDIARHVIGPYFFDGTVSGVSYLEMLRNSVIPELSHRGIMEQVSFQQDGASSHFTLTVCIPQWSIYRPVDWVLFCSIPFGTASKQPLLDHTR